MEVGKKPLFQISHLLPHFLGSLSLEELQEVLRSCLEVRGLRLEGRVRLEDLARETEVGVVTDALPVAKAVLVDANQELGIVHSRPLDPTPRHALGARQQPVPARDNVRILSPG